MQQHDHEWGVPTIDDQVFFERFVLDGAQCGLSWSTILKRREHYKRCFCNWDIDAVAALVRVLCVCELFQQSSCLLHMHTSQQARCCQSFTLPALVLTGITIGAFAAFSYRQ